MEPFVPERDGRIGKPSAGGASTPKAQADFQQQPKPTPPAKTEGGKSPSKLLVIALFAICALLLVMNLIQWSSIGSLQQQFDDLKAKIDSTDESLSHSGTTLSLRIQKQAEDIKSQENRVNEHFAEIDKLWAARKKINENIATVEASMASLDKKLGGYDQKISASTQAAKDAEASLKTTAAKLQGDLAALRKEVLDIKLSMDSVQSQGDKALAKATEVERSVKQWQARTDQRLAATEEAIRAIDSFRQQTNAELTRLRNSSGGSLDSTLELEQIRDDIEFLKKQHPFTPK